MRYERASSLDLRNAVCILLTVLMTLGANGQGLPDGRGALRGTVFTAETGVDCASVPSAKIRIQQVENAATAIDAATNESSRFYAAGLIPGRYRISVEFTGMQAAPVEVAVQPDRTSEIEIELKPAALKEEITVSAQVEMVDATETESKAVLHQSALENVPNLKERLDNLLPLLQGVVRGPDGLINMKGARTRRAGCFSTAPMLPIR
jgi:hypothetical protein